MNWRTVAARAAVIVFLAGCAGAAKIYGPSGREAHVLSCGDWARAWSMCYEKAGEISGPRGFNTVRRDEEPLFASSILTAQRRLVIECRDVPAQQEKPTQALASASKPPGERGTLRQVVERITPSVVRIETERGTGSGFVIAQDGAILTNAHVVEGSKLVLVHVADGRPGVAAVQRQDPDSDVALLVTSVEGAVAATLGRSQEVHVGDEVAAMGVPFGLERTVTKGIVSAIRQVEGLTLIQMDAAINPGSSEGPLLNMRGEVVGIMTWKRWASEGIGFAIGIDHALSQVGKRVD